MQQVCCTYCAIDSFWFLKAANILQCADFLLQRTVNITAQFADMIPYLATTMQFADVGFALLQILPDGKAPCNELMLHHAMQCTGASCRMLQIPSNFAADSTQLRDSNSKDQHVVHRYFYTEVLSQRHVFTHGFTHARAFTQGWFYTQLPSCAGVFTQGCFFTKTFAHRCVGTCTYRCLYTSDVLSLAHVFVVLLWCFGGVPVVFWWY